MLRLRPDTFDVIAVPESAHETRIAELLLCRSSVLVAKGTYDNILEAFGCGIRRSSP
jgi:hypothetical protein